MAQSARCGGVLFPPGRAQEEECVARLGVWGAGGGDRDQGAFGVDQEQQVGGRGDPAVGRLGGDTGASGVAGGQSRAGEGGVEQGVAGDVGGDGVGTGRDPVNRGVGVAREGGGGQGVEVVFPGEQEDGGDAFQFGTLGDGRGELLAAGLG